MSTEKSDKLIFGRQQKNIRLNIIENSLKTKTTNAYANIRYRNVCR